MTEIKVSDLAAKIRNAEPLTDAERESASTLLKFSETIGAGIGAARSYGGVVTLSGWHEGEDSENGDTPMFFVIACNDPHPDTWAAIQAALNDDDAQPQPAPELDQVGELLAIMHSDGGHYQTEHGTQKAARDALKKHIALVTRLDAAEYALKVATEPKPAPSAETGNHVSGLTPAPDALREALVSLRAEKPISHAIKPWGEEMRELMAAFERHAKGQRHITVPRLDREEWKGRNGSYYQNGETNSLFLMFMAGYQSAKPGWLDGHYHDWHKERAALAEAEA